MHESNVLQNCYSQVLNKMGVAICVAACHVMSCHLTPQKKTVLVEMIQVVLRLFLHFAPELLRLRGLPSLFHSAQHLDGGRVVLRVDDYQWVITVRLRQQKKTNTLRIKKNLK